MIRESKVMNDLHGADIRIEGGEDDLPVLPVPQHGPQHLVQEQVHLHRVLVLLLLALEQPAVLDLNVEPAVLVQLAEDVLQGGERFVFLLSLIPKTATQLHFTLHI